ncbi:hypothetical protein QJS10_CPB15g00825 [Acorus calamus]|uniref:Autophagy-related protein 2 n=1 Tax=Acorus calamus TaxID=4465 RepID=A0AAV9D826_ACOCL|nr:hypothetical protein QJS10_CPB15g00825 [Acorus calamus]
MDHPDHFDFESHISVDGHVGGDLWNFNSKTTSADDVFPLNCPNIGLETIQSSCSHETLLPQLIESYYISDLLPAPKSSLCNYTSHEDFKSKSSLVHADAEYRKGGWYEDIPFRIHEDHILKENEQPGETQLHNICELPSINSASPSEPSTVKGRILLKNIGVKWRMYAGSDWPKGNRNDTNTLNTCRSIGRDTTVCLELSLSRMNLEYDMFPEGDIWLSKLSISVQDFYLYDHSRDAPWKMKFDIWPVVLRIDYIPHYIDLAALREGKYAELVNLVNWKIHKLLKGLAPIRSLFSVSSGAAKLVSLPLKSYKKDHRLIKGVQRGATAFLRSISVEAVGLGVHLAAGAHDILLQTENVLASFSPSLHSSGKRWEKADVRSNQPRDAQQGIHQAYESITDGLGKTASALVSNPLKTYQRGAGAGLALVSAIQAAPAAAVAPASAAARAVHCALLGLSTGGSDPLRTDYHQFDSTKKTLPSPHHHHHRGLRDIIISNDD